MGTGEDLRSPTRGVAAWSPAAGIAFAVLAAATATVVVLAGVLAAAGDFQATSDTGMEIITTRGIFTENPPLLGSHSSADPVSGVDYHHPGPMLFYLAAPLVGLLDEKGMPLACALVNAASVLVVAVLARRWGRPAVATAMLVGVSALVWTMGSGLLTSMWNPHIAMLPFAAGVAATWAAWQGSRGAVVSGALTLSLVAEVHLPYLPLAAVAVGLISAAVLRRIVLARRAGDADTVRAWSLAGALAVAAGILSALGPLVEQLANGSDGNLARILQGSGFDDPTGLVGAGALVLSRLTVSPWFLRSGWERLVYEPSLPGAPALALGAAAATLAIGAAAVWAVRRRDPQLLALLGLSSGLLAVGTVLGARFPLRDAGTPAANFYWAWPLAALVSAAVLAAALEWVEDRRPGMAGRLPVGLAAVATVGVLTAALPYESGVVDNQEYWQERSAELMDQALPRLEGVERAQVVSTYHQGQFLMAPALINRLLNEGVEVGSADDDMVEQLGESFRSDRTEPWVLVFTGPETSTPPTPGAERIALVEPYSEAEARELYEEVGRVAEELGPDGIVAADSLSEREREELVEPALEEYRADPAGVLRSGSLALLLAFDLVEVRGRDPERSEEVIRRQVRQQLEATALWLVPREEWVAIGG